MSATQPVFTLPPRHIWIDHTNVIETDRDTLYALLCDIDRWPQWTPGLKAIWRFGGRDKGLATPGTFFMMSIEVPVLKRLFLPCVMYRNGVDRIEWGGGAMGSTIRHYMELTPAGPGRTRLRHVEGATGLLALAGWPAAGFAHMHDLRWSKAIEARFAGGPAVSPV
ncbi:MAG: hypothetical protein QM742_08345 [Aquabacterium sp.]